MTVSNPGRKSEWCRHSVPNRDDIRVGELELGEVAPTMRKIAVQPMPVPVLVRTPFVRLRDECFSKAV